MKNLPVLDFEKTFRNSINPFIIPCNTEVLKTKKQAAEFVKYIFTDGGMGDVLSTTCDCGKSQGAYRAGSICSHCKTIVREPNSTELGYNAWLEIPECLPPLLQPIVYHTLDRWMGAIKKQSILNSFLDPEGKLPEQLASRFETGVMYFYTHFDEIMEYMFTEYKDSMIYNPAKRKEETRTNKKSVAMKEYLRINRAALFTRHYPALDRNLHVLTKQGTIGRADNTSQYILKVAIEIANVNLVYSMSPNDKLTLERNAYSIITTYAAYSETILDTNMLSKYGFFRRHILGSRCHFSFRAVIIPITDLSMPDEIKISWSIAIIQFKLEVLNLLINRYNMSFSEAQQKHQRALGTFDPTIHEIFKTLIAECPYKGLPTLLGRNPTLVLGSIQLMFITEIKTDMSDDTISMHHMSMKAPNADCDGDALYASPIREMDAVAYYMKIHPSATLLTSQQLEISNIVNIGTQAQVTLNNWLSEGR